MILQSIRESIKNDNDNAIFLKKGWEPICTADARASVLIIGQAPGRAAQDAAFLGTI